MQRVSIVAVLFLSGCITIEMPGVVTDMVRAAKDAYKESTSDKADSTKIPAASSARFVLAHSYVGKDSQTEAEIMQLCIKEAAQKLARIAGKELSYVVLKSEVVTLNNNTYANCELGIKGSTSFNQGSLRNVREVRIARRRPPIVFSLNYSRPASWVAFSRTAMSQCRQMLLTSSLTNLTSVRFSHG